MAAVDPTLEAGARDGGWTASHVVDAVGMVALAAGGLYLLGDGLSWLRRAHLFRQAGEGVVFAQVAMRLAAGGALCLLAAGGSVVVGRFVGGRVRLLTVVAAGALLAAVVASFGIASWVGSLGERCFRGCT